jgi:hypothetical protein
LTRFAPSSTAASLEFRGDGNVRYRIRAVIPLPLIEEFAERPLYGCWEVERVA